MKKRHLIERRRILQAFGFAAAGGAASLLGLRSARSAAEDRRFLIVLTAFGGGAIIDSFLPIRRSEVSSPALADRLDCYPDDQVVSFPGSPIRAVDARVSSILGQNLPEYTVPLSGFAAAHRGQMMVTTVTGTSVNHAVAQRRALSGGGAWSGRTMQEIVAQRYGEGLPLPNVNMGSLGYLERGADPSLPSFAYGEAVPDPFTKPLSFSAHEGLLGVPDPALLSLAREVRDDRIDAPSAFYQTFRQSERVQLWKEQRRSAREIEAAELVEKLLFVPEGENTPLSEYGLASTPELELLLATFPDLFADPVERQAALAYLLIRHGVSSTVTLGPSFNVVTGGPFLVKDLPLAFDGSHADHRSSQALEWYRVLSIADKLIGLLRDVVYDEDTGETFWDRTMIHVATDFGRDKVRPEGAAIWGAGHHMNNGHLTISPLVAGDRVLGGVDPDTGLTFGFDLETGAPRPGTETAEAESFAGLLQALGVDTSDAGLPDVPAMRA